MRIFLGMDQTLCDFNTHFLHYIGLTPLEYKKIFFDLLSSSINENISYKEKYEIFYKTFWKIINDIENFWETIPPTKGFKKIWKLTKKFNPIILTAAPITQPEMKIAINGKIKWVQKHLTKETPIFILPFVNNAIEQVEIPKYKFCKNFYDILIDDNQHIVEKWVEAGGIGILYNDDNFKTAIDSLNNYINLYNQNKKMNILRRFKKL